MIAAVEKNNKMMYKNMSILIPQYKNMSILIPQQVSHYLSEQAVIGKTSCMGPNLLDLNIMLTYSCMLAAEKLSWKKRGLRYCIESLRARNSC